MSTRYISVITSDPGSVEAYLYAHTNIVSRFPGPDDTRATGLVLRTEAKDSDVDYLVNYQADRLSSGLHGTKVHASRTEALQNLLDLGYDVESLQHAYPAASGVDINDTVSRRFVGVGGEDPEPRLHSLHDLSQTLQYAYYSGNTPWVNLFAVLGDNLVKVDTVSRGNSGMGEYGWCTTTYEVIGGGYSFGVFDVTIDGRA